MKYWLPGMCKYKSNKNRINPTTVTTLERQQIHPNCFLNLCMLHLGSTAIHHLDDHGPSGDEDELLGLRDVLHIKASCGESSLIY